MPDANPFFSWSFSHPGLPQVDRIGSPLIPHSAFLLHGNLQLAETAEMLRITRAVFLVISLVVPPSFPNVAL